MSKYIGYKGISNEGCAFEVLSKGSKSNYFLIRFEGGFEVECSRTSIMRGVIKNPYHPSVYGVGYIGVGNFSTIVEGKIVRESSVWRGMLRRCYNSDKQEDCPTYKGCSVAKEWFCFQTFAAWITSHKNWGKEGYHLDKDLKFLGSKIYSAETCDLVPVAINTVLNSCGTKRGDCVIGVSFNKRHNKYVSCCNLLLESGLTKSQYLGSFNTEQEAFFAYKKAKEENVKLVAQMYKDEICEEIYNNLVRWTVPVPNLLKGEM